MPTGCVERDLPVRGLSTCRRASVVLAPEFLPGPNVYLVGISAESGGTTSFVQQMVGARDPVITSDQDGWVVAGVVTVVDLTTDYAERTATGLGRGGSQHDESRRETRGDEQKNCDDSLFEWIHVRNSRGIPGGLSR